MLILEILNMVIKQLQTAFSSRKDCGEIDGYIYLFRALHNNPRAKSTLQTVSSEK